MIDVHNRDYNFTNAFCDEWRTLYPCTCILHMQYLPTYLPTTYTIHNYTIITYVSLSISLSFSFSFSLSLSISLSLSLSLSLYLSLSLPLSLSRSLSLSLSLFLTLATCRLFTTRSRRNRKTTIMLPRFVLSRS